jgi:multidrug efflux pump subunit AcrA (membrane-fusion protein)
MASLQTNEVVAKKELNKVKAEFQSAQAEYNSLHLLVNLVGLSPSAISRGEMQAQLTIRAKASGWIAQVNVRSGELVTAENPIATLIDESGLQIELAVFEKDYAQINIGQEIFFTVQGSSEEMKATIVRKGMEIDDKRSATVYAEFSDTLKNRGVSFGSFVSANVVQRNQSSYALPPTATVERGEGYRALRVVQKTTEGYELEEVYISGAKSSDGWRLVPDYSSNSNQEYLLKGVFDLLSE